MPARRVRWLSARLAPAITTRSSHRARSGTTPERARRFHAVRRDNPQEDKARRFRAESDQAAVGSRVNDSRFLSVLFCLPFLPSRECTQARPGTSISL